MASSSECIEHTSKCYLCNDEFSYCGNKYEGKFPTCTRCRHSGFRIRNSDEEVPCSTCGITVNEYLVKETPQGNTLCAWCAHIHSKPDVKYRGGLLLSRNVIVRFPNEYSLIAAPFPELNLGFVGWFSFGFYEHQESVSGWHTPTLQDKIRLEYHVRLLLAEKYRLQFPSGTFMQVRISYSF